MKTKAINIFIVEDNDLYAKSLKSFIYLKFPYITEITIFRIGEICLLELDRRPDIVIMDYFLNAKYEGAQNGLEIIKQIKKQNTDTHIIVLSNQDNYNVVLDAIKQYGCFYVQKDETAFNKVEQMIKNFIES